MLQSSCGLVDFFVELLIVIAVSNAFHTIILELVAVFARLRLARATRGVGLFVVVAFGRIVWHSVELDEATTSHQRKRLGRNIVVLAHHVGSG